MKIAFVADNDQTISAHFGRAPMVVVVTVEDGAEVAREVRSKEAHGQGGRHVNVEGHDHSHDAEHHRTHDHSGKLAPMADCQVMVVRGIGGPAVAHAEGMGLKVFLTKQSSVDAALAAYLSGQLDHDERRIHHH